MCKRATVRVLGSVAMLAIAAAGTLSAQFRTEWRRVGNASIDYALASVATGPVVRVWYSSDGAKLHVRTFAGRTFETTDFETWRASTAEPAEPASGESGSVSLPEPGAKVRTQPVRATRIYAFGRAVYRSDDGGAGWNNVSQFRDRSIIGDELADLAVSPRDDEEIAVAASTGIWRSMDGGLSWSGLNHGLPNLPVARLYGVPESGRSALLALNNNATVEWMPGERHAWRPAQDSGLDNEIALRRAYSTQFGVRVTAVARSGDFIYLGIAEGRLAVSSDNGRSWASYAFPDAGAVERFWIDPRDPRTALAAFSDPRSIRIARTINAGRFWDPLTADLPEGGARGVAADRATGAVYLATDAGLFITYADLVSAGAVTPWGPLNGLPEGRAVDVRLDSAGNQLYVAMEGYGVYATMAPHRARAPRLVNAADFSARAAAPGSLVSVLGRRVENARAGSLSFPVLAASESETQIQVPFEAPGSQLELALDGRLTVPLEIRRTSPAIFVDRDGSPMVLDADSGIMLDAMTPARSNTRVQILATGLGRVRPEWPTGIAAPLENPPEVASPVRVFLDRAPVEVTRAVLAPYIGFYIIELELPKIVNYGPAELYLEVEGQQSNRVRVYIEP